MKTFYYFILSAICLMFTTDMYAQTDRNIVLHFKDLTTQKIPVASIDSISFESSKPEEKAPFTVELTKTSELYAEYGVIPDDPSMTYNVMCEPKSVIDEYASDDAIFEDDKIFFSELAEGYGMTMSELLENFLISGEFFDFHTGLLPDTDYVMYLYGMSYKGEKTTPMMKVYFKTMPAQHINNKIAIDAKLNGDAIDVTYTPDDDNLRYTAGLFSAYDVMDYDELPNQLQQSISNAIIDYILGDVPLSEYLEGNTSMGKSSGRFEGADPNSEYYVVAAYLDDECGICSDVTIKTVGGDAATKKLSRNRMMKFKKAVGNYRQFK